jgi:MFS family permease
VSDPAKQSYGIDGAHRRIIVAASLGTVFEWYDFFVYGTLAVLLSKHFFQGVNETTSFIFALLGFAAGFAIRPLGAVFFGRLGDLVGRKYTFLVTIVLMGVSTALLGALPTYANVGIWAPIMLITLRLLQGLALGGEYGGAATYVAEHAPPGRRGYYTSWIQLSGGLGLVLALVVVLACRITLGEQFDTWGWRLPFLLSLALLAISVYIRVRLDESPVFAAMQRAGTVSRQPLGDSFGRWANLKVMLLALFGLMAGQTVLAYVTMVYAMYFLMQALRVDPTSVNFLVVGALAVTSPLYLVAGRLSDRIGRKPVFLTGCVLGAVALFPVFHGLTYFANPAIAAAQVASPVTVVANPAECSFQFDPLGKARFSTSCDVAKSVLAKANIPYSNERAIAGAVAIVRIGDTAIDSFDGSNLDRDEFTQRQKAFSALLMDALETAGYPKAADPARANFPAVFGLLCVLGVFMVLTYAPLAAWLVELFPARIRYTSMSVPYHIGTGWFGGFLPSIAFAITAYTGNIYSGLWYPVIVASITIVVCTLFVRDTKGAAAED